MLNVIFLSPHCDPQASLGEPDSGGQCIYEHELATALSGLPDYQVTTFCRQNYQRPDESIVNNSYSIQRLSCGKTKDVIPKEELEAYLNEFTKKVHTFITAHFPPDTLVIHGHYWDGAYTALYLKKMSETKLPFIWTPHSLGSTKHRKFPGEENEWLYNFIPRFCWESYATVAADSIILSSEEEKKSLEYDYVVPASKIQVISPGINLPQFISIDQQEARKNLGLPKDGKILLCLGRIVKSKGYQYAIQALAELKKIYQEDVYLVIVGGSLETKNKQEKNFRQELKTLNQELGLAKNVIFLAAVPHDQIHVVFSAADIFLMTSEHEPFGLVTLEAMAMRKPVIAANTGGSLNTIIHNQTGILVNFHESERTARYILSLIKDDYLYQRITEKAYQYVKKEYDWYPKSVRFAQAYRQVSRFNPVEEFHSHIASTYFLKKHFER